MSSLNRPPPQISIESAKSHCWQLGITQLPVTLGKSLVMKRTHQGSKSLLRGVGVSTNYKWFNVVFFSLGRGGVFPKKDMILSFINHDNLNTPSLSIKTHKYNNLNKEISFEQKQLKSENNIYERIQSNKYQRKVLRWWFIYMIWTGVILEYFWSIDNNDFFSHIHNNVHLLNSWWGPLWMWEEEASFHYTLRVLKNFSSISARVEEGTETRCNYY